MAAKGIREKFVVVREQEFFGGSLFLFGDEELYDSYASAIADFTENNASTESFIVCRITPEKRLSRGPIVEEEINGN